MVICIRQVAPHRTRCGYRQTTLSTACVNPDAERGMGVACRYPLLLDRLLKLTPEGHVDRNDVMLARRYVEETLTVINAVSNARSAFICRIIRLRRMHEMYTIATDDRGVRLSVTRLNSASL